MNAEDTPQEAYQRGYTTGMLSGQQRGAAAAFEACLPKSCYVFTTGSGEDGDQWDVHEIFLSREAAEAFKLAYDSLEIQRIDGSTYRRDSNPIEEWPFKDAQ